MKYENIFIYISTYTISMKNENSPKSIWNLKVIKILPFALISYILYRSLLQNSSTTLYCITFAFICSTNRRHYWFFCHFAIALYFPSVRNKERKKQKSRKIFLLFLPSYIDDFRHLFSTKQKKTENEKFRKFYDELKYSCLSSNYGYSSSPLLYSNGKYYCCIRMEPLEMWNWEVERNTTVHRKGIKIFNLNESQFFFRKYQLRELDSIWKSYIFSRAVICPSSQVGLKLLTERLYIFV